MDIDIFMNTGQVKENISKFHCFVIFFEYLQTSFFMNVGLSLRAKMFHTIVKNDFDMI